MKTKKSHARHGGRQPRQSSRSTLSDANSFQVPGFRFQDSRRSHAFTLVEILLVLAIIGLLVGVLVTKSDKIFGRSQTAVAGIFVRNSAAVPLLSYRRDMGDYPSTQEGLQALVTAPTNHADSWHGPYMDAPGGR